MSERIEELRAKRDLALQLIRATASADDSASVVINGKTDSNPASAFSNLATHISTELTSLAPFIYCLAELQETRLPCSEEVLMKALTCPPSASSGASSVDNLQHTRTDARLLVRTWLHDEGCHREVLIC